MTTRLTIVGDAVLDVDVTGNATRLAPEAPVPVIEEPREVERPGGAALAAILAAAAGADVTLITPVVDDPPGRRLMALLAQRVDVRPLPATGTTCVKQRIRSGGTTVLRVHSGDGAVVHGPVPADIARILATSDAVLVSDYAGGCTSASSLLDLVRTAGRDRPLVWDPHRRGRAPVPGATLVTPNGDEAAAMADAVHDAAWDETADMTSLPRAHSRGSSARNEFARAADRAARLRDQWAVGAVCITLGSRGALLSYGGDRTHVVPARRVPASDTCGAGDAFAATASVLLASGALIPEAVAGAVEAATDFVAGGAAAGGGLHLVSAPRDAWDLARRIGSAGGTVVAAGGCFDLLHAGHVSLLESARRLGDCLIVCLNSDESVRRLKGSGRPIMDAPGRAAVLNALGCVDGVVEFDEDTPRELLRSLRPDLWVKGADYAPDDLPEAAVLREWGGRAVVLPYLPNHSSTSLIRSFAASPLGEGAA